MNKRDRVIITGAGGILGTALTAVFRTHFEVIALDHKACDITDPDQVARRVVEEEPHVLINAAVLRNVDQCEQDRDRAHRINVDGVGNLAAAAEETGALFVQISSDCVFDGTSETLYEENHPIHPINHYGVTKAKSEELVRSRLEDYFIIRTCWIFGQRGNDFVGTVVDRIDGNGDLRFVHDKFSNPTYNMDLAGAIMDLIRQSAGYGTYHITNAGSCSWYDYAEAIAGHHASREIKLGRMSLAELGLVAKRPGSINLSNEKFHRELGYRLRPWQEALREYMDICYREGSGPCGSV